MPKQHYAGIAISEEIGEAIKASLRMFPKGVEAGDIIYALLYNLQQEGARFGMSPSEVTAAWNAINQRVIN